MQVQKFAGGRSADVVLESAALARVIDEVRIGETRSVVGTYNRTYNRHNR